ncbi:molecular chaperone DnaJ [SAR202 cluster bacterium AC-647-N09_OGT_505m]|nr:molecular chaperone DnaJ [SAR202 cluster bacterium AC-647-N09_OGT_505m]
MTTNERDYYKVLGVPRTASQDDIRTKFRRLALEYHPDRNKEPSAQEKFKEINSAYQVLSDPQKRAQYDRFGHVGAGRGTGSGFEGSETFGGFGDIFDAFFGGFGTRTHRAPQSGHDIQATTTISFDAAVFGVEKEIEVERVEPCNHCKGVGAELGSSPATCPHCNGTGQVRRVQRSIFGQFAQVGPCNQCNGEGKIITNPCSQCNGSARQRRARKIKVDIPPGVENGMQVRLTREGNAGRNGGPPGNLYIQLRVEPHEIFQRRDHDILLELPINFVQAALGDEFEVPTLSGPEIVRIPAGTQSGTVLHIKGKGVPYSVKGKRGDQLVVVNVVTPRSLDERQRQLFEELADTMSSGSKGDKGWLGKIKDALGKDG